MADENKPFLLSDDTVNSYGFRLNMEKLDLSRFKENPVCLYNHNALVGRWDKIELKANELYATPEFMDDPTETEAARVKNRVDKGFVKGASLGINILSVTYSDNEPPLVEAEVLECSVVDVPSNRNALRVLNADGSEMTGPQLQEKLSGFKPSNNTNTEDKMYKLSAEALMKLGLKETAAQSEIEVAIIGLSTKNAELQTKLDTQNSTRIEALLSGAIAAGKINATEKASYELSAKENFDFVASVIDKLPGKKTLSTEVKGGNSSGDDTDKWTFKDWREKDSVGLQAIAQNEPDRYREIVKKK